MSRGGASPSLCHQQKRCLDRIYCLRAGPSIPQPFWNAVSPRVSSHAVSASDRWCWDPNGLFSEVYWKIGKRRAGSLRVEPRRVWGPVVGVIEKKSDFGRCCWKRKPFCTAITRAASADSEQRYLLNPLSLPQFITDSRHLPTKRGFVPFSEHLFV